MPPKGDRIAKVIARAGLCSRRDAEAWILEGRVSVDGEVLKTPAFTVTSKNKIKVDGKSLPQQKESQLWLYYKPKGLITTHKDEKGRPTLFDALPKELPRVISVGRLDFNSEGLILLTNDGSLARYLEMPSTGWTRRYRVRVHGKVDLNALENLKKGITVKGIRYGSIQAALDRQQGDNAWLTVSLKEGKNREIRRIFEHLGWPVNRLIRTSYGPFQLGSLKAGEIKKIPHKQLIEQISSYFYEYT